MNISGNPKFNINIVVARHGSTILNEQNRYQGSGNDYPLTQKGANEIALLKQKMDKFGFSFDAIITSDTIRAQQTAEILTDVSREKFVVDPRIKAFDLGDAEAKREDEMFTLCRFPILARHKENFAKYLKRVRMFLRDTLAEYNGKTILIVTHEDISGLIDSYLSNYFILKAPRNGIKNGNARFYRLTDDNVYSKEQIDINPKRIHFRGPRTAFFYKDEIFGENQITQE